MDDASLEGTSVNSTAQHRAGHTSVKNQTDPKSNTVRMVQDTLSQMPEYPTKDRLWRALPVRIPREVFERVLRHLEGTNKMITDRDGTLVWIFADTPELKKLRDETEPLT